MSWLNKLKQGLQKTAGFFSAASVAEEEALEEALIRSDMGIQTTTEILKKVHEKKGQTATEIRACVRDLLIQKMIPVAQALPVPKHPPMIFLIVGVNGAGKTTTIGKMAHAFRDQTKALVAGDTFRAGAVEQLKQWADKTGSDFYAGAEGCDAAGLIFDALKQCQKKKTDLVFIDTAGRLQNRVDLMNELKKIHRVIQKVDPSFPHETILVLDATVGQNALSQVKIFNEVCPLTGLVMTKLDGTAKGGILVALADKFSLPIYAIGVGEGVEDFNSFTAEEYVDSLLGE